MSEEHEYDKLTLRRWGETEKCLDGCIDGFPNSKTYSLTAESTEGGTNYKEHEKAADMLIMIGMHHIIKLVLLCQ